MVVTVVTMLVVVYCYQRLRIAVRSMGTIVVSHRLLHMENMFRRERGLLILPPGQRVNRILPGEIMELLPRRVAKLEEGERGGEESQAFRREPGEDSRKIPWMVAVVDRPEKKIIVLQKVLRTVEGARWRGRLQR